MVKELAFWLTKKSRGSAVVKASISNDSSSLIQRSSLKATNDYKLKIFSEDAVIYKVLVYTHSVILVIQAI